MRVTLNHTYATTVRNINKRSTEYQRALEVASTGKQVDAPSADAASYSRILGGRSRLVSLDTYTRNLQYGISQANFADSALQTTQNALSMITEKVNAGVSETLNAEERAMYAQELRSLSETIRRAANSEFNGRMVFGGGMRSGEVFDESGVYRGGSEGTELLAGDGYTLSTGLTGDEIFGAAGGIDIFALIDDIATALENDDPTAAHARQAEIGEAIDQISTARAFYGAVGNHAEALIDLYEAAKVRETEANSMLEDADMAKALSDLGRLNTALQATLQASAEVNSRTLFEYL